MENSVHPGWGARFFEIYKRGQGYYTRMISGLAAGILILAGADYIYDQLALLGDEGQVWFLWVRVGVPMAFMAGLGTLIWWLVGVNRKACDFMIATEGEMKKVSWSSKKEIIGSTKVVIFFTVLMAVLLFVFDVVFQTIFSAIGVLKGASMGEAIIALFKFK